MKKLVLINIVLLLMYLLLPEITASTYKLMNTYNKTMYQVSEKYVYLQNKNISFDMNLLTKSNLSAYEYEQMFKNTNMEGLGNAFEQAESITGVNGIYLASLGCLESNFGRSNFAKTRNNLFGYQSYDSNLDATKRFNTKEEGVLFVAQKIKNNYLTDNGAYYSGYTISSVSKRYATDKQHANKIYAIMLKLINKLN